LAIDKFHFVVKALGDAVVTGEAPHGDNLLESTRTTPDTSFRLPATTKSLGGADAYWFSNPTQLPDVGQYAASPQTGSMMHNYSDVLACA
jgi:hypothetical protein